MIYSKKFSFGCIVLCNLSFYFGKIGEVLYIERNGTLSIANQIARINGNICAAYSVCSEKGATLPQVQNSQNLADTIDSISQGDGAVTEKDVNFYDCDGIPLYSYTFAEALALSALPALPTREGLTAQGWNHTLSQIQSAAADERPVDVGAQYITDDGCTRLYMHIPNGDNLTPTLTLTITGSLTLTVDWGDGTSPDTLSASGALTHTWNVASFPADVMIEITPSGEGTFKLGGNNNSNLFAGSAKKIYAQMLKKAELGAKNLSITPSVFRNCYSLESIVVPQGVTEIGANAFVNCYRLKGVVIPDSVTQIYDAAFQSCYNLDVIMMPQSLTSGGAYAFQNCCSLRKITFPEGITRLCSSVLRRCSSLRSFIVPDSVTQIDDYALNGCHSIRSIVMPDNMTQLGNNALSECPALNSAVISEGVDKISSYLFAYDDSIRELVIPDSVTSIYDSAFSLCYSLCRVVIPDSVTIIRNAAFSGCSALYEIDLSQYTDPSALPTITNTNVLYTTPNDMIIYVADQAMLSAFSAATNWSSFANRFQIKGV